MRAKPPVPITDELGPPLPKVGKQPSTKAKRARIIKAARRHFAKHGYEDARMEGLANELGIAKGSIFQHFGSKKRLLLETLKRSHLMYQTYLDAPSEVLEKGFFETVRYWLEWANCLSSEDCVSFRLWLVGNYGTGLDVKREISRMFRTDDPSGVLPFVRMGVESGVVRDDIDPVMIARTLDLMVHAFEEARITEECDPGFFRTNGEFVDANPDRVDQYLELIRSAIGKR